MIVLSNLRLLSDTAYSVNNLDFGIFVAVVFQNMNSFLF